MSSWSFCSLTFHSALCTSRFRSFSMSREWRCDSRSNTLSSFRLLEWKRQKVGLTKNLERLVIRKKIEPISHKCLSGLQDCLDLLWTWLLKCNNDKEAAQFCCWGLYKSYICLDLAQRSLSFKSLLTHYVNHMLATLASGIAEAASSLSMSDWLVDGCPIPIVKLSVHFGMSSYLAVCPHTNISEPQTHWATTWYPKGLATLTSALIWGAEYSFTSFQAALINIFKLTMHQMTKCDVKGM